MRRKLVLALGLVMLLSMAFVGTVLAADEVGTWELSDIQLPEARCSFGSVYAEGKLYVIGGSDWPNSKSTVYAYDFGGGTWERKADLPIATLECTAVYFDGKIYTVGGHESGFSMISTVYEYNIATDEWTTKANLPASLSGVSAVAVDGKLYACGGQVRNTGSGLPASVSPALYVYDPQGDTWTQKANMLTAAVGSAKLVYHNGEIYFFGGLDENWNDALACQKYNIAENKWYKIADMPMPRAGAGIVVVDKDVYVIGGYTNQGLYDEVHKYSLDTDSWEQVESFPIKNCGLGAEYVNGQIYAFGGFEYMTAAYADVYTYTPQTTPTPPVASGNALLRIYIVNGLELEYDTTIMEVNSFVNWFNNRANGIGPAVYAMKKTGNMGPFNIRTDYLVFDKIVNWEVNEYVLQ